MYIATETTIHLTRLKIMIRQQQLCIGEAWLRLNSQFVHHAGDRVPLYLFHYCLYIFLVFPRLQVMPLIVYIRWRRKVAERGWRAVRMREKR